MGASHLKKSNLSMDILTGRDCDVDVEDIFGSTSYFYIIY